MKMSEVTRLYEIVTVMRQEMSARDVNAMVKVFTDIIEEGAGVIVRKETWGMRSLAYEVQGGRRGHYTMMKVKATPEVIKALNDCYRLNKEQVVRFNVFRTENTSNAPSWMMRIASDSYGAA